MVIKEGFLVSLFFKKVRKEGGGGALIHEKHLFDITTWGGQYLREGAYRSVGAYSIKFDTWFPSTITQRFINSH